MAINTGKIIVIIGILGIVGIWGRDGGVRAVDIATVSAEPVIKENITEPRSKEVVYRLESVLEGQKTGGWNGLNSVRKLVRVAIDKGVSANTIVLLLLLPMIATTVSFLHYIVGVSGYGIFMPTMIGVTFLATGIGGGLVLFGMILAVSLLSNVVLKKWRLHFWPARSINLLLISMGTFGLMTVSAGVKLVDIRNISIFPVLFLILLTEEFVRTQLVKSKGEAKRLTLGTLILAISGAVMMSIRRVQETVLLYPEVMILLVLGINLWVGSYSGIRLLEIGRFKKAIR